MINVAETNSWNLWGGGMAVGGSFDNNLVQVGNNGTRTFLWSDR